MVVGVVFDSTVHDVAVVAEAGQGVTRSGLGLILAFLVEFFPLYIAGLKQTNDSYRGFKV